MIRTMLLIGMFGISRLVGAQGVTLADVKAMNAVQLSAGEVNQLMPGAKIVHRTNAGSTRRWENNANGTFAVSSDAMGSAGGRSRPASGNGTWLVNEKGAYCVTIQWAASSEDLWCRYIFKAGDKYYGFGRLEDTRVSDFDVSK